MECGRNGGGAGTGRPSQATEDVSILSEGNRSHARLLSRGGPRSPSCWWWWDGGVSEGAAAGIRERCQVFPMMPPVGADGRVCRDPF